MLRAAYIRPLFGVVVIIAGILWILHTQLDPTRATLYLTTAVCGVTAVYALITFEILLQNRAMAKAATDSTNVMERSLRFSFAPDLRYRTVNTRDPTFDTKEFVTPIDNEDYQSAVRESTEGGQQQTEFVFAIVQNFGRGVATNLTIDASYAIHDSTHVPKDSTVRRQAVIQMLEKDKAVALCICMFKVPTNGDQVQIASASVLASDYYRDFLHEPPQTIHIDSKNHYAEPETGSTVRII